MYPRPIFENKCGCSCNSEKIDELYNKIQLLCPHKKWKQEYLFEQKAWFRCELCGKEEFWCGTLSHKKPSDCKKHFKR